MQLSDVQRRFKETILDHPDVVANPPEDIQGIFQTDDIPLSERLKVYRNNIIGSLTDVMLASFPTIEALVGKEFMEAMSRSFILENPPSTGCLNSFGPGFAEFIENFEPAKSLSYLPDVARLEIALNDAYYARDDKALSAEELAEIAPEDLANVQLLFRDNVQLLHSIYPISDIRDFALSESQDGELDIDKGPAYLMIYRPKLDTEIIILDEAEYFMLLNLKQSNPLGAALEAVMKQHVDFDFQSFLQKHIFLETFSSIKSNA